MEDETILRESPLVSAQFSWNEAVGYRACHYCLEPLETTQENVTRLSGNAHIVLPHGNCCPTKPNFHVSCPRCGVR